MEINFVVVSISIMKDEVSDFNFLHITGALERLKVYFSLIFMDYKELLEEVKTLKKKFASLKLVLTNGKLLLRQ